MTIAVDWDVKLQPNKKPYLPSSQLMKPFVLYFYLFLFLKQHKSGFAKKIWSLETPEDVKKWREERKK